MTVMARVLLCGVPHVGKSTLVERLAGRLRQAGVPVEGFFTREVRSADERVGFACHAIAGGGQATIAHTEWRSGPRVGRYGVDIAGFERVALPALERAIAKPAVVIIDEIADMELLSTSFVDGLQHLMAHPLPLVATVHAKPHPLTDELKRRADVEVVQVTPTNRDLLVDQLSERFIDQGTAP